MSSKDENILTVALKLFKTIQKVSELDKFEILFLQLLEIESQFIKINSTTAITVDQEKDYLVDRITLTTEAINLFNSAQPFLLSVIDNDSHNKYVHLIYKIYALLFMNLDYAIHLIIKINEKSSDERIKNLIEAYSMNQSVELDNEILDNLLICAVKDSEVTYLQDNLGKKVEKNIQAFKPHVSVMLSDIKNMIENKRPLSHALTHYSASKNHLVIKTNNHNSSYEIYGLSLDEKSIASPLFVKTKLHFNPYKACYELFLNDLLPEGFKDGADLYFDAESSFLQILNIFFMNINYIYFYDLDVFLHNEFIDLKARTAQANKENDLLLLNSANNPS